MGTTSGGTHHNRTQYPGRSRGKLEPVGGEMCVKTSWRVHLSGVILRPRGGDDGPKGDEVAPDGSWSCKCGNVNYPFRTKCNRRNCGLDRDAPPGEAAPAPQRGEEDQDQQ
eukprot:3666997-Pyramimonas_sp.AAC.1